MTWLGTIANIAAIITALVAAFGYGFYICDRFCKRRHLEKYLKSEKEKEEDRGQRSLLHLMAKLGMTEAELLQASFRSKNIDRKISPNNKTGRAEALLLE